MDDTRAKSCCFTGHRSLPADTAPLKAHLRETLVSLIEQGVCYFAAGGALGFDTLAAQTVLELKNGYPHIRLILVLPCKDQTCGWPAADVAEYERILSLADKTVWLSERYYKGCMHARNRRLVDNAGVCVCYRRRPFGGTAYTVDYAKQQKLAIYEL